MARPIRVEFEDAAYHVMARGNERRAIFRSDQDRRLFLETLGEAVPRFGLLVHAYCLMPNHYHLVVETPRANLSRAMGWLQVTYTVRFNRRHRRCGHLFQGRFKAHLVSAEGYGMRLVNYVHLNPVRPRGKDKPIPAERAEELDAYPWSSHPAYAGLARKPVWLCVDWLRFWGRTAAVARSSYRVAMAEAFGRTLPSPWDELRGGLVLGTDQLWERTRRLVDAKETDEELHWTERRREEHARGEVKKMAAKESDADIQMWLRVKLAGERMVDVARDFGYRHQSGVTHAVNRVEALARVDRKLAARLDVFKRRFSSFKS